MLSPAPLIARLPFLRKPVRELLRVYAQVFLGRFTVQNRLGLQFLIDRLNAVDRNLLLTGSWEAEQIETLLRLTLERKQSTAAGQTTTFLDIGAHGGIYSMVMARHPAVDRVVAFEPEPNNLAQMRANLFLNDLLGEVEVLELAASDSAGTLEFLPGDASNRGKSRLSGAEAAQAAGTISVEAATVDESVQLSESLVVAKIDVEGSELRVLAGMERTIGQNACVFQIESFAETAPHLKAWMAERGFEHVATVDHDLFFVKG